MTPEACTEEGIIQRVRWCGCSCIHRRTEEIKLLDFLKDNELLYNKSLIDYKDPQVERTVACFLHREWHEEGGLLALVFRVTEQYMEN